MFNKVQIRRIKRKKNKFAICQNVEHGISVILKCIVHISLIFDKGMHVFRVINITVV